MAVLLIAVAHATLVGHYPIWREPRFAWECVLIALILVATYATGVTESRVADGDRLVRSAAGVGCSLALLGVAELVLRHPVLPLFVLGGSVLVVPVQVTVARLADRTLQGQRELDRALVIVGAEERPRLLNDFKGTLERPAALVAAVDPRALETTGDARSPLRELVESKRATLLVLDREAQSSEAIVSEAARLHGEGLRIRTLSLFYDEWFGKLPISELERIALLFDINEIHGSRYARLKRLLDVVLASAGLVACAVVLPFVALADLVGNRGPIFYRQQRVGKNGTEFTILKFRTMRPGDAPSEWTAEDDPRLTSVGRAMRTLHLDELPQVWNILRRELSIVGPRPEQPHYVEQLSERIPFYDTRHLVRPGLTGWAQVKYDYGASELDALEKLQYDFYYLRHQSLALDLRIIGRTLRSVAGRQGR